MTEQSERENLRDHLASKLWQASFYETRNISPFTSLDYAAAGQEKWKRMADIAIAHCETTGARAILGHLRGE